MADHVMPVSRHERKPTGMWVAVSWGQARIVHSGKRAVLTKQLRALVRARARHRGRDLVLRTLALAETDEEREERARYADFANAVRRLRSFFGAFAARPSQSHERGTETIS